MSQARFASITADLLVRKGEAKPWQPPMTSATPAPAAKPRRKQASPSVEPHPDEPMDSEHIRRMTIRMSECEYQRLGIIAVKKNTTRQRIARQAIDCYLTEIEREYGPTCGCLSVQGCPSKAS